ncbi:hypothetical protein PENTCL1PPCAC_27930 [Pristionchus entomophagus]|uniref:BTB domain-containing protein n=1 Tax=Pristionchus entomophagus TaxID=358040 RepID=A0AAV5UFH9_9BILA|nr:hypothetical protein PENTCL1PPCAC_27930 [Pristionchus entomophagus]
MLLMHQISGIQCRDTKDFINQKGRGKFQVEYFPPVSKISVEAADDDEINDGEDTDEKVEMNLREMLDSELFSDCIIKVGTKSMKAHQCIIGPHSDMFKSMFFNEIIEVEEEIIDITLFMVFKVRAMIECMFTGSF